MRQNILQTEVSNKVGPANALKPAIKNAFYIKEQRFLDPEKFVEPDDASMKYKETGTHLIDYMKLYKANPNYVETDNDVSRAIRE